MTTRPVSSPTAVVEYRKWVRELELGSIPDRVNANTVRFTAHCAEESGSVSNGSIAGTLDVLFEPGAVVELRAFRGKETVSGYFDDHDALAEMAHKLDTRGYAVYATLNEVDPALLSRAANRTQRYPKATTSDADVTLRRWLPVDLDPVRPADVSATYREKAEARRRATEVRRYLRTRDWPDPVVGDSGNGYHLLYRVDLPNDQESLELIRGVLETLSFRFSCERVNVDTAVANAARIWKLYGTTARKGDDTEDRPHRASAILEVPREVVACRP